jgi:hypothetical protein
VTCEFCGQLYHFDQSDTNDIFDEPKPSVHWQLIPRQ